MNGVTAPQQPEGQYVVFRLADEQYGIPISAVREIIELERVSRLPEMPEFVEGITDLRGQIIPIVSLRKRFHLAPRAERQSTRTIVVELGEIEAGLLVDDVVGVVQVPSGSVQPPPAVASVDSAVVSSVARVENRLVILLNPDLLLADREQRLLGAETLAES